MRGLLGIIQLVLLGEPLPDLGAPQKEHERIAEWLAQLPPVESQPIREEEEPESADTPEWERKLRQARRDLDSKKAAATSAYKFAAKIRSAGALIDADPESWNADCFIQRGADPMQAVPLLIFYQAAKQYYLHAKHVSEEAERSYNQGRFGDP